MAFKCVEKEWNELDDYTYTFICDAESDIADLPKCGPGSVAMVAAKGAPTYMTNASGEWVVI